MTHDNAYNTVQKYHRAWTSGDIDTAMSYVADDITCRAPGVDLDGKDAYRESSAVSPRCSQASATSPSSSTKTA